MKSNEMPNICNTIFIWHIKNSLHGSVYKIRVDAPVAGTAPVTGTLVTVYGSYLFFCL